MSKFQPLGKCPYTSTGLWWGITEKKKEIRDEKFYMQFDGYKDAKERWQKKEKQLLDCFDKVISTNNYSL